jgi:hypothetical protein
MKALEERYPLMEEAGGEGSGAALTEEQIAAAFSTPVESDETIKNIQDKKPEQQQENQFTPNPLWDYLKSDEGFKMPENISKDNESQLLEESIKAKYGAQQQEKVLHPLAQQIQEMADKNPDISINDLLNTTQSEFVDISKYNDEQKIAFHYFSRYGEFDADKNPDGVTEEDINKITEKMSKIEKKEFVKQIEENVKKYNDDLVENYDKKRKEDFASKFDKVVETNNKHVDNLKTKLADTDSIFGIKVSPDERDAFVEEFRAFITPDKETMQSPLEKMLSDDVILFKTFVLAAKFGEDKVIEAITKGRESAKEELFRKLKLTPEFSGQREDRRTDDPDAIAAAFMKA